MADVFRQGGTALRAVADAPSSPPSFDVLDDIVRLSTTRGFLAVRTPTRADASAVAGHVERRAGQSPREVIRGSGSTVESAFRDVAARLGIDSLPQDAAGAAREIARAANERAAAVVVSIDRASGWDQAVGDCLVSATGAALFVVVVSAGSRFRASDATWFELDSSLDDAGLSRWWETITLEARRAREGSDLAALERWRDAASRARPIPADCADLDAPSREFLLRLACASRAWPEGSVELLGSVELDELVARGFVERRDGLVAPSAVDIPVCDSAGEMVRVGEALAKTFPVDPWAYARAAELFASAGRGARAETLMARALELAADAGCRSELWRRWSAVVESADDAEGGAALVRGAELAVRLGDVDVALDWAERATKADRSARAAFVLGRASLARGDLVSARAALMRAHGQTESGAMKARAAVELGEVHYAGGDLEAAKAAATEVLSAASDPATLLGARNLMGKLLLAEARWDEADRHFAEDAVEAVLAGQPLCEMRARVNRAIAVLSRGNHDEARPMLEDVLVAAEERGELRAVGFALSNLAVLAIERHEYRAALDLAERTISVRRRLGERLGFARDVTNLVELRLRLGLVGQAEEALRFGRHALGPGAPASRLTELALAAARVHLARGRTLEAEREAVAALKTSAQSTDGEKLGECHRLLARIALEDGVVARARSELTLAEDVASTPFARAEVALLNGLVRRAAGEPSAELAERAVARCRESGDEDLAREAHVLAADVALAKGDLVTALHHVDAAVQLRDQVADDLGAELASHYLRRRDLRRLGALEVDLADNQDVEAVPESPAPPAPRGADVTAGYVGQHPLVRALVNQVQKVGPTGATVLIHGESGTGKELVAEGIHRASTRRAGPLVKVNCAALVESLLLSELFGHEKGAFTGAAARKRGRFERADGGTLFLDEIGDISERTQVALLRVLEERTIERVGGSAPIKVDVRIICATNRDLRAMVARGEFREDLYYRLAGINLDVPSLRDRLGDLPVLCENLLGRIAAERGEDTKTLSPEAMELLARHAWPGNVRELDNALRAASLFAEAGMLSAADFSDHVESLRRIGEEPAAVTAALLGMDVAASSRSAPSVPAPANPVPLDTIPPSAVPVTGAAYHELRDRGISLADMKRSIERECISQALKDSGGNITRAAAILGMKRPRLSQLVKQYGLLPDREEEA